MIDIETFVNLSDKEVARLVSEQSQRVCIFPVCGIRPWYTLEYGKQMTGDRTDPSCMNEITKKLLDLYNLLFSQGFHTLVSTLSGAELLAQEGGEMQVASLRRLEILTTHPDFLYFYEKYGVRVHFFGNYQRQLAGTPYAYLTERFGHIVKHTRKNSRHRLFYGLFTENAGENLAELAVRHFISTGKVPNRQTLMELYYGDVIESADVFIGFDKFRPSDYPLLELAEENLYFTVTPSFYLTKDQLRRILYDQLYLKHKATDYTQLSDGEMTALKDFYHARRGATLGLGKLQAGAWTSPPNCQP